MHPDLSRHWPTEEYNVFINWLRECHKNYSIWEIFSHCNDPDQERRKCLNSEDTEKKTKSREYNNACKKDVFNPAEESEKQITGCPFGVGEAWSIQCNVIYADMTPSLQVQNGGTVAAWSLSVCMEQMSLTDYTGYIP
ncbi:COX assembly mitochondrial protein 2 homolog [Panthera uncia]|uniref:COX assembly mitochondrial protein 2 homolog n=1 Tax=Panthera uncia TaxID=29064 RepID=UPI0020FF9F4B|nr:COX assembly mitochondrial protein 2 homolog [Panthera uncia]